MKVRSGENKDISIHVSMEMPFEIREIQCLSHKIKVKVSV